MTRYIVSGYIGFDNFGDEAIAHVLTEKLKSEGVEDITLISSNPQKTKLIHQVNSCGMLKFLYPLIRSDVLISGGGSLLQDVTSLKSLMYYLGIIYCALILGKKVEIFAQGIGPINSKIGRILTRLALKRVNKITVRDEKSQKLLENWGISSEKVNDPILDINIAQKKDKNGVGVQLRDFQGVTDGFLKILAKEISQRFKNSKIKLISLQDSIDLDICNRFLSMLKNEGIEDVEILSELSVNDVIDCVSSLEYLIAMRFHANVIGIKSGVKTLAINYDPKVETLAEQYNLPYINLDDKSVSQEFDKLLSK